MKYHSFLIVAMLAIVGCATQQERAERKALMKQAVKEAVAERKMYIDIIELIDSGRAYIHVRALHRDPISFDGELAEHGDRYCLNLQISERKNGVF